MRGILIFLLALGFSAAGPALRAQGHGTQKKYFPKEVRNIYLGMSMESFAQRRSHMAPENLVREDFRYRWTESFPKSSPLVSAIYYFGVKDQKPLYEIVLLYRDLSDRGQWVRKRLGPPNFNDREWKLSSAEGFVIRAWLHEEKLIFAAPLEGTEWEEENGDL